MILPYFSLDYKEVIGRLIKPLLPNILFCRINVHKVDISLRTHLKQYDSGNKRFIILVNLTDDSVIYFS